MAKKKTRSPVGKKAPAKQATKAPVKKAKAAAPAPKKRTPAKKKVAEASPSNGKKKPPLKEEKLAVKSFDDDTVFRVGDDVKTRLLWAHKVLGSKDELATLTAVFEAGLQVLEETLTPKASGNLVDADEDEEYDGEFEEGWHAHTEGLI